MAYCRMPKLDLDAAAVENSGLGEKSPGDIVYAWAKLTVLGDKSTINGVRVDQLGPIEDVAPSGVEMTDLYNSSVDEAAGGDATNAKDDGTAPFEESAGPSEEDQAAEEKMLGYKRPLKKNLSIKKNLLLS